MDDLLQSISISILIMVGCPLDRAYLLLHIQQCDKCRLAFQQAIDRILDDAPRELRVRVSAFIRARLEDPEVVELQSRLQADIDQHYADPSNRPN